MDSNKVEQHEVVRKRKYMPLAFVKNATASNLETGTSPITRTFTPMSFKRSKFDNEDRQEMNDDYEARPSLRPVSFISSATTVSTLDKEEKSDEEETTTKLTVPQLNQLENLVRTQKNAFKGKKYGMGAALLKKMGYVEGQGLGKHGQGITEPIEQDLRKAGVGIGGGALEKNKRKNDIDLESDDDSDEEYYKNVPKISLFEIIVQIEAKGVPVPNFIKNISNHHSKDSHKPFIELKKEGNADLEELTQQLNEINNQLNNLVLDQKSKRRENDELIITIKNNEVKEKTYKELLIILKRIDHIVDGNLSNLEKIRSLIKEFQSLNDPKFKKLNEFEIDQTIVIILKPLLSELFENWNPLDIIDTALLETAILIKNSIPEPNEIYGELSYFQSLLYSLWYPHSEKAFESWTIEQPNVAITLLLDWGEVLDESIIDYFTEKIITPKIIEAIKNWSIDQKLENPPYVWIFEWIPYLQFSMPDIVYEFRRKYEEWFENWDSNKGKAEGIRSLREIIGDEEFTRLIEKELIPKLVSFFINFEIDLATENPIIPVNVLFQWIDSIDSHIFENLVNFSFFNCWLRSLYYSLKDSSNYEIIANNFNRSVELLNHYVKETPIITDKFIEGLDLINQLIENGKMNKIHLSLTENKVLNLIFQKQSVPTIDKKPENRGTPLHKLQVSFKDVVEDYCINNNLFFQSMNNDLTSGHLLFKISRDPSSKNSLISYIDEDVLWVKQNEKYIPVSLESINERI